MGAEHQSLELGAIVLDPADDVAVLIVPAAAGTLVGVRGDKGSLSLTINQNIPMGHKIALHALPAGGVVRKYGEVIGCLTEPVAPGDHVHIHNLASLRAARRA